MAQFDPLYGELLNSREVSEMTGFSMNQLRNFRIPARHDKMPFGYLKVGGNALYRKAVIDAWLEENGVMTPEYVQAEIDKKVPLNNVQAVDSARKDVLNQLGTITTENSFTSMATWAIERSGLENGTAVIHDNGRRLLALERGIADWKTIGRPNPTMQQSDQEAYWKIWTYGVRYAYVLANQLDVTDEEIIAIPVGSIPPLKTK
jgi:hypothetical protein